MVGQKHTGTGEGGIETAVGELSEALRALGETVICIDRPSFLLPERTKGPLRLRGIAAFIATFLTACRAAACRCDVVHFHGEGPCAFLWIPYLSGKRCVVTIHGLDHRRPKWGRIGRRYILFGEKLAVRFAASLIVLGPDAAEYFRKTYGRKTVCIPNGVRRPEMPYEKRKDGGYFLYVGRLVPDKGLHTLLEAFRTSETDRELLICGKVYPEDAYCRELTRIAGEDSRIRFLGFRDKEALDTLYREAFCFVLPSQVEGMSMSLLEARAHGCRCLVSDIPESDFAGTEEVYRFPAGDAGGCSRMLDMISALDPVPDSVRKEISDGICGDYPWEKAAELTRKVYRGESV